MEWTKKRRQPGSYFDKTIWFAWYPVMVDRYENGIERWKWLCYVKKETNGINTYFSDLPKDLR